MDYYQVEQTMKADYRQATRQYRLDDEIEVTTENHRRLCATIKEICQSFNHPIHVLEVGCGTGRYFHCVQNVRRLVGLDVSDDMLNAARNPVRASQIVAARIELIRGNAYLEDFPAGSFDFIYSLGMFGNGCPVTAEICQNFHRWLAPGGKLLFNIVDPAGLPMGYRVRRTIRAAIYLVLTPALQKKLDDRESKSPFFCMTTRELKRLLKRTSFLRFHIESHECKSPLWSGRHLQCLAERD
jgi:SAM-dependent methyltransferase